MQTVRKGLSSVGSMLGLGSRRRSPTPGDVTFSNINPPAKANAAPQAAAGEEAKPAAAGQAQPKPELPHHYESDIGTANDAFVSRFVEMHHDGIDGLKEKYDTRGVKIGQGGCGSVSIVHRQDTGDAFAMKTISLAHVSAAELRQEIEMQRKLDHPSIVRIFESYEDHAGGQMYIIMELCTGDNLVASMRKHRHGYGERAAATLVEKVLSAITYCHHHGIVHRDIKLDNIMYESNNEGGELKLIDFGFAKKVRPGHEFMSDHLGTPSYMAPELWSADKKHRYDSSVDIWAIGVTTYLLLVGKRPFDSRSEREKIRRICEDPVPWPSPECDHVSAGAKDFVEALLRKKPSERLSAKDALTHPWVTQKSRMHEGEDAAHVLDKHNEIVQALQHFATMGNHKKLALEAIAFSTPPAKLHELRDVFKKIDVDDSGTISLKEFQDAMAMHTEIPQERVVAMFQKMDEMASNHDEVDYTTFLAATLESQEVIQDALSHHISSASLHAAFNMLDKDHDGYITEADLESMEHNSDKDTKRTKILRRLKTTPRTDGMISYHDFEMNFMAELGQSDKAISDVAKDLLHSLSPQTASKTDVSRPPYPLAKGMSIN